MAGRISRILERILKYLVKNRDRDSIFSDFEDIYDDIAENKGKRNADLWYLGQVIVSIVPIISNSIFRSAVMFRNYIKITWRNILKHKVYSVINIAGLAVGIACCLLTVQWIQYEVSYDRFHKNKDSLYRVVFHAPDFDAYGDVLPGPAADFLREEYPEIIRSTVFGYAGGKISHNRKGFNCTGAYIHNDFFKMFDFPLASGNPDRPFQQRNSILITEETAKRLFGEVDPIGKRIRYNDRYAYIVTGIVADIPVNSELQFDFLLSYDIAPNAMKLWNNKWPEIYVQLENNADQKTVNAKIIDVFNDHNPGHPSNNFLLWPLENMHLYDLGGGGLINYIYVYSTMAAVLLIIACFNYMNLATARSLNRMNEIGIKKVVGSTRFQLIKQFMSESLILTFIAFVIAVFLAKLFLPSVNNILGRKIAAGISGEFIFTSIAIGVVTGILSGSYPAIFLSSFSPNNILKGSVPGSGRSRSGASLLRKYLVTVQYALSIIFVISAIVIFKQLNYMKNSNLGFKKENVLILRTSGILSNRVPVLKEELSKNPDILAASASRTSIVRWGSSMGISWPGRDEEHKPFDVIYNLVDYDYLDTFGLKLVKGRFLSEKFPADAEDAFVINEACVRAMEIDDPIGVRITQGKDSQFEDSGVIVGVIKDYHNRSLRDRIMPMLFKFTDKSSFLNLKLKSGNNLETIGFIKDKVEETAPSSQFNYWFLDDEINNLYRNEETIGAFIIYLTILAIFISSLGLLGLTSYTIQQRIKEVGIRKVFGAPVSSIILLFSKDFTRWILVSNLVAWPAAYFALNRWLESFAYQTDIGVSVFVSAGLIALTIAMLTIASQTLWAANSDPVQSLRYE